MLSISLLTCKSISLKLEFPCHYQQERIKHRSQRLEHMKIQSRTDKNRSGREPKGYEHTLIFDKLSKDIKHGENLYEIYEELLQRVTVI